MPYLPGLDGMRALAVVAVMIFHANHAWMPAGFLGVEVFFVISGYLITLLLIAEDERDGGVSLRAFWGRRFRRLLPALYLTLIGLVIYCALFMREQLGHLRGDVVAAVFYVSNWFQIWVGQGYGSLTAFVPLRHLWSLAVEEQFYLVWPLVMVWLLRKGRERLPQVGLQLIAAAFVIAAVTSILFHKGVVSGVESTPDAYWSLFGRDIDTNNALYLSTITRASGILLGAGFAMLWRPVAMMRGPMRTKGRQLDLIAAVALVLLVGQMLTYELIGERTARYFPPLFNGGLLLTGVLTVVLIAAVTHSETLISKLLGHPVLNWIGTRSYGLYLF
ncbi:MAG TPA: acyltransferase, partial [Ilumatobacteraceae bacterium]|nr:acyltransferase [Ilumatobacteraceae bacterium]